MYIKNLTNTYLYQLAHTNIDSKTYAEIDAFLKDKLDSRSKAERIPIPTESTKGSDLMQGKETPKGSFRDSKGRWFVACWECTRGINGNQYCSCGVAAKSLKVGCFIGKLLDKYLPDQEGGNKEE